MPSVAIVDGVALGGGAELALACDLRVAGGRQLSPCFSAPSAADYRRLLPKEAWVHLHTFCHSCCRRWRCCACSPAGLLHVRCSQVPAAQWLSTVEAPPEAASGPLCPHATVLRPSYPAPPRPAVHSLPLMQASCRRAPSAVVQKCPMEEQLCGMSCILYSHLPSHPLQPRCSKAPCGAGDNAIFAFPETRLGIIPGAGGTQRLPRVVGRTKAKELIFTGSRLDARRAYDIGGAAALWEVVCGPTKGPLLTPMPAEQLRYRASCSC